MAFNISTLTNVDAISGLGNINNINLIPPSTKRSRPQDNAIDLCSPRDNRKKTVVNITATTPENSTRTKGVSFSKIFLNKKYS